MNNIKGSFNDFNFFKKTVNDWNLDFNIISKGDFNADFHLFTSDNFLLSRETLNGTIEHRGYSPIGYRTVVIPINYGNELTWYKKRMQGKEILIFPKNPAIDVTTYDGLDIFLFSIEEEILSELIEKNNWENCKSIFNGDAKEVPIREDFSVDFFVKADKFMNTEFEDREKQQAEIEMLAIFFLEFLNKQEHSTINIPNSKQNKAVDKALEIIHNEEAELTPVGQLCKLVGVSERTLYNAFKNRFKASPNEYVKAIRLNKVKKELFTNENESISSLAGKYHFWHMGQFAKDFKNQFGVLPSDVNSNK